MNKLIIKNSFWLLSAQIITKIISFFYTIFLAKNLAVGDFGQYVVSLSYFSILTSISDFGINRYLIREVVLNKKKVSLLLFNTLILRMGTIFIIFIFFSISLIRLDPDKFRVQLSLLVALAVFPNAISLTLDSIYVALQQLNWSAIGALALSIVTSVSGFIFISSGIGAFGAALAIVSGYVFYTAVMMVIASKHGINLKDVFNLKVTKEMFMGSIPYGLLSVIGLLYFKVDSLILSYMKGSYDTGIYGAAYKFLEAVVFIPTSFSLAMFPTLTSLSATNPINAKKIYTKSLALLFALSIPIALSFWFILPVIINQLLPNYSQSITAIKILALTIPWLFMIVPQNIAILSESKYLDKIIFISLFNLFLNVCINLFLIPKYTYIGSSFATVISDVTGFIILSIFISKYLFKDDTQI